MIPPRFEYHAPSSLAEAVTLLAQLGDEAKILAGGHSLLPMMKFRFAEPAALIDLNRIESLRGVSEEAGKIRIGAMTTENLIIASDLLRSKVPLLPEAARQIADPQVRNRGTIGGDIVHGDPANDHPAIAMALEAIFVLTGPNGERQVPATEFFHGTYFTALEADEVLTAILIDPLPPGAGYAYAKLKRKTGDWATAASAVVMTMEEGRVAQVRIGLTNVAPTALRATEAEEFLVGKTLGEQTLEEVARLVRKVTEPVVDLGGDEEYKTAMAGEMTKRALRLAASRCR
jgi:carbon-monoxide dehydrogenase medium subunit